MPIKLTITHTQKMLQLLDRANTALQDWATELKNQGPIAPAILTDFEEIRDQLLEAHEASWCEHCDKIVPLADWNYTFRCCSECGEKESRQANAEYETKIELDKWIRKERGIV